MVKPTLLVLTLAAAVTANPFLKRDTSCTDGPIPGGSCQVQCGIDYPGGDYGRAAVNTFAACESLCLSDPNCATAQYNTGNSYCYLKNAVNEVHASSSVNSVVCGQCGVSKTSGSRTCTTVCNKDRQGGNYAAKYTSNIAGCLALCTSDPKCVTAQFRHSNGYCYLKSSANALDNSAGTDTIDCVVSASD